MNVDEALALEAATTWPAGCEADVALHTLAAAVRRVRVLHQRQPYYPYCEICPEEDGWPCPTLKALDGEL